MNSVVLSVQTLDVVNDILDEITGYGRDRKVNFQISLSEEDDDLKLILIYNDTGKVIFEGTIKQDGLIEAVKSEDAKEKASRKEESPCR